MSSVSCKNGGVTFGSERLSTPEKNSSCMEHHQDILQLPVCLNANELFWDDNCTLKG